MGNLADRANEKVSDIIRSRGGKQSNVNRLQTDIGEMTLGEAAKKAAQGDKAAKQAIKMSKQANKKGQQY